MHTLPLVVVIYLKFENSTYTFSEDTSVSDAEIAIVIENYDNLIIDYAVEVTVITAPNINSNATEHTVGDGMFLFHFSEVFLSICKHIHVTNVKYEKSKACTMLFICTQALSKSLGVHTHIHISIHKIVAGDCAFHLS